MKGEGGAAETKRFSLGFVSRSQYKFRDLTVEEVTAVSRAHPNFSFSMNTYSKKGCGALKGVWVLACLAPWGNTKHQSLWGRVGFCTACAQSDASGL